MNKQLVKMRLAEIIPYENNPRHNDNAVEAVKESIRQCEYIAPIIVDEDYIILAGHTRAKALDELGVANADVMVVSGLSDEQKRKYRLLDNKTNEIATWDIDLLELELEDIDFDGFDFGFDIEVGDWFDRKERDGKQRQDGNEEYNEFLDKFEIKKTTDDCYTPDVVYDAIADWVANEYKIDRKDFVRPFYPNGDYQKFDYRGRCCVDNPPFSILSEIVDFYTENGIRFFLFAPTLTMFGSAHEACSLCVGVAVTYENGASVNTSFITNLETGTRARTAPTLYKAVKEANDKVLKELKKQLPKYEYCDYIVTSTRLGQFSRYGIEYSVPFDESTLIRQMDCQKESDKAIYGSGLLVSERLKQEKEKAEREKAEREKAEREKAEREKAEREKAEREKAEREKAEREKAEREKAERWNLSEREMEIVKALNKGGASE